MKLVRLRTGTLWRLGEVERQSGLPGTPPWIDEVEEILFHRGDRSLLRQSGVTLLAAEHNDAVIGAALHLPSPDYPGAQYIAAVLVDHRHRGRGLGRELLSAVIDDALDRTPYQYVTWLVHHDNTQMLALSDTIGARLGPIGDYESFVHP